MLSRIREVVTFVRREALSGVLLILASLVAIVLNNFGFSDLYYGLTHATLTLKVSSFTTTVNTHEVVNDFLMSIFFLLVGLEIKREFISGQLSDRATAMLPFIGAVGGMLFPALVYVYFNGSNDLFLKGWAIPTATDIAFSLGVLSLFGRSLPFSLKVFLTALAIIDDLLAILVIAFFYTADLAFGNLIPATLIVLGLALINRMQVKKLRFYLIPGIFLFYLIHHSGVHATIAGVILAMTIPLDGITKKAKSPLKSLEHTLHPWVAFWILPIFAFVNGGVSLKGLDFGAFTHPIALGCMLGLFFGKQIGVFVLSYLAIKLRLGRLPEDSNWAQFYGISILTGIGFTMSLFIGRLAFNDETISELVKLGVLSGSIISTLVGALVLFIYRIKTPIKSSL